MSFVRDIASKGTRARRVGRIVIAHRQMTLRSPLYLLAALVACGAASPSPAAVSFDRFVRDTYPGVPVVHPVVHGDGTDGPSWKSTCHWSKLDVRPYGDEISKRGYPFFGVLEGTVENTDLTSGRVLDTRVVRVTLLGETVPNGYRWSCSLNDLKCGEMRSLCKK